MVETRNILLIGRTGGGKSTLANVLSGTNEFEEGKGLMSKTKKAKSQEFEIEINNVKVKYKIIDTPGVGDTGMDEREVLRKIGDAFSEIGKGLHQVFFVVKGRFTKEEWKAYKLIRDTIFGEEIGSYTTIIRTDFSDFENEQECKKSTEKACEENSKFRKLFNSCNRVIYVDSPPINVNGDSKRIERQNSLNREIRDETRQILLNYLIYNCGNHFPVSLNRLVERFSDFKTDKEKLETRIEEIHDLNRRREVEFRNWIKSLEAQIENPEKKSFFPKIS